MIYIFKIKKKINIRQILQGKPLKGEEVRSLYAIKREN